MHLPDGFLDARTAAASAGLAVAGVALALRDTHRNLPPRRVPMMGLAAAFVFAAQMLNFPVLGGTSGHLIGGVLTAVLLGPGAAVLVLTSVLIIQCFMFADGGFTTLGANIFNMGIVSSVGGYALYRAVCRMLPGERGRLVAVAFASWCATVVAAIVCAGQLALSGSVRWSLAFPAMTNVHMLIGIGEALITTLIVYSVTRSQPDFFKRPEQASRTPLLVFGMLIALGLALFVSPFACTWPDGLDHVAEALGFQARAASTRIIASPIAEYRFPWFHSPVLATAAAGAVGTVVAFGLSLLLARMLSREQKNITA